MRTSFLPVAALAAFSLFALSASHAQTLGGALGRVKARAAAALRPLGAAEAPTTLATPTSTAMLPDQPGILELEDQVVAALRQAAPTGTRLLVVGCQASGGSLHFRNAYLTGPATGVTAAGSLPDLPAAIKAKFAALRQASLPEHHNVPWEACKLTLVFGQLPPYNNAGNNQLNYDYDDQRGMSEPIMGFGFAVPSPAGLLAQYQQVSGRVVAARQGAAAQQAKESRRVQEAEQAAAARAGHGAVTWTCTQCHHTTRWPEKPDGFDTGACPAAAGESRPHQWAR